MKIKRFEDLEAWQIARELTNQIYAITRKEFIARDFGFIDQIRKAAISTMNNISEVSSGAPTRTLPNFFSLPGVLQVKCVACCTSPLVSNT